MRIKFKMFEYFLRRMNGGCVEQMVSSTNLKMNLITQQKEISDSQKFMKCCANIPLLVYCPALG